MKGKWYEGLQAIIAAGTNVIGKVRLVTATGDEVTDDTADAVKAKLTANSGVDIGDVDVLSIAAGNNNIGDVDIASIAAGNNNIGDVDVASIAAGTNAIGKIGHDTTGLGDGRKAVTTAGVRETLVAASTPAKWVLITSETDNTDIMVVGAVTVVAALATRRGIPLYAGESVLLLVDDLVEVYLDSMVSTEGVTFVYGT